MEEPDGPHGPPLRVAVGVWGVVPGGGTEEGTAPLAPAAESEESTSQRLKKTLGEAPLEANNLPAKRAAWGGGSVLGPWPHANRWAEST